MEYRFPVGYNNWTKGTVALGHLREGLHPIVVTVMQRDYKACIRRIERECKIKHYTCSNCSTLTVIPSHEKRLCNYHKPAKCNCSKSRGTNTCPQAGICGLLYHYIIEAHTYKSPFWSNCDFRQISQNDWEFIKCFLPGYREETMKRCDDFDPADLLNICLHYRKLSKQFSNEDILKKAKYARNTIMHSGTFELENKEVNTFIDYFITVLKEKPCQGEHVDKTNEAIRRLEKLKSETIIVSTISSVCGHRDAVKSVLEEIKILHKKSERLKAYEGVEEDCTVDMENDKHTTEQKTKLTLDDINERLDSLHDIEQKHMEMLEKHQEQCEEIKVVVDEIRSLQSTVSYIKQITTETHADVKIVQSSVNEMKTMMTDLHRCFVQNNVPIPVTRMEILATNIDTSKEKKFHDKLTTENTKEDSEWEGVKKSYTDFTEKISGEDGQNMMEVTETKQECLAVYIQCWSPKAILKLCEDCVFGKLTALLKPVEKQLRKIHGYELVSLEIVIYWKDFMRCFETIVRRLKRSCSRQRPSSLANALRSNGFARCLEANGISRPVHIGANNQHEPIEENAYANYPETSLEEAVAIEGRDRAVLLQTSLTCDQSLDANFDGRPQTKQYDQVADHERQDKSNHDEIDNTDDAMVPVDSQDSLGNVEDDCVVLTTELLHQDDIVPFTKLQNEENVEKFTCPTIDQNCSGDQPLHGNDDCRQRNGAQLTIDIKDTSTFHETISEPQNNKTEPETEIQNILPLSDNTLAIKDKLRVSEPNIVAQKMSPPVPKPRPIVVVPPQGGDHYKTDLALEEMTHTRWKFGETEVVELVSRCHEDTLDVELMARYPINKKNISPDKMLKERVKELSTYKERMHAMLYAEEIERTAIISRMNMRCLLLPKTILSPSGNGPVMYAQNGFLFGQIKVDSSRSALSPDSPLGRLVQNVSTLWLAQSMNGNQKPEKVYELTIESVRRDSIDVQIPENCVEDLNLKPDVPFKAEVQLQLNRLWLCEMHNAVDSLETNTCIYPTIFPPIQLTDAKVFRLTSLDDEDVKRCNEVQLNAIMKISLPMDGMTPPLLIVGPFGTGKTYTLAQAAKCVVKVPSTRVLICTHSNSEADIYITDYFHAFFVNGNKEDKPLRIYYERRRPETVSESVKGYCLMTGNAFRQPNLEDIEKHRIIITTVRSAKLLSYLEKVKGMFTHIFLDEAAQVLETELLIPLALADQNTKVVLAGDHMQMSPQIYSSLARKEDFHVSLIERLYNTYSPNSPYRVTLCDNYRTNSHITRFMSELFYDGQLKNSADIPAHPDMYPLSFQVAKGKEEPSDLQGGYCNYAEVAAIVNTIQKLKRNWPIDIWNEFKENEICVVAPYKTQIELIRGEIKKEFGQVNVERVTNVQGKQFRVLIISVVRTCNTHKIEDNTDLGFLSNKKVLTTVITRAKSLVIAVGEPETMCTVGECSGIWTRYIDICREHGSFNDGNMDMFEQQWDSMEHKCDSMDMKLNPMAEEFKPSLESEIDAVYKNIHSPSIVVTAFAQSHVFDNGMKKGQENDTRVIYEMDASACNTICETNDKRSPSKNEDQLPEDQQDTVADSTPLVKQQTDEAFTGDVKPKVTKKIISSSAVSKKGAAVKTKPKQKNRTKHGPSFPNVLPGEHLVQQIMKKTSTYVQVPSHGHVFIQPPKQKEEAKKTTLQEGDVLDYKESNQLCAYSGHRPYSDTTSPDPTSKDIEKELKQNIDPRKDIVSFPDMSIVGYERNVSTPYFTIGTQPYHSLPAYHVSASSICMPTPTWLHNTQYIHTVPRVIHPSNSPVPTPLKPSPEKDRGIHNTDRRYKRGKANSPMSLQTFHEITEYAGSPATGLLLNPSGTYAGAVKGYLWGHQDNNQ
ncbi:uncharacterized protein LOC127869460 isoform X2 [Dreissena polymorpha]|uniref:uncharacterized protein LOC127869460 isoform X2 n=1 Tax=Dreissena polymorpha TaxID=45954 RepID=UPI002264BF10|nr:uncharacterized protein LOC127869460 isoform X2 [Dreissena polymorpha]